MIINKKNNYYIMEEKKKLGFWDFVDKHPIITFILGTRYLFN